jgi:hypothetical protein
VSWSGATADSRPRSCLGAHSGRRRTYLAGALKHRGSPKPPRLADQRHATLAGRSKHYLAAMLEREISARNASGAQPGPRDQPHLGVRECAKGRPRSVSSSLTNETRRRLACWSWSPSSHVALLAAFATPPRRCSPARSAADLQQVDRAGAGDRDDESSRQTDASSSRESQSRPPTGDGQRSIQNRCRHTHRSRGRCLSSRCRAQARNQHHFPWTQLGAAVADRLRYPRQVAFPFPWIVGSACFIVLPTARS